MSAGFSPDMVYMAMGRADQVETKDFPEGRAELWTYNRYYPNAQSLKGFEYTKYNVDSAYSPAAASMQTATGNYANSISSPQVPLGMDRHGGESIGKTGGPQGGSMEPADLQSFTVQVLFQDGKVAKMAAMPNVN